MHIRFSPQRTNGDIAYVFDGDIITATMDGRSEAFDFSALPDGEATNITSTLNPCPVLSARRVDGVLHVTLLRAVPPRPQTDDEAVLDAWRALWGTEQLPSDIMDEPPTGDIAQAVIEWKPQTEIDAEREAQAWASLRAERDRRLAETDWIMLPDAPVPPGTTREQWQAYRQALRDVPQQPGAPYDVTWPTPPTESTGE